jgi:hypothetical protein
LIGTAYADIFNTSVSIVPVIGQGSESFAPVTQSLADDIAAVVGTWWGGGGALQPGFASPHVLQSLKLNRIGVDGHYMDPVTIEHLYTTPVVPGVSAFPPAQLSTVATIRTVVPRGLASKGRMYFPPALGFTPTLDSTGRATVANAQRFANCVADLFDKINDVYVAHPGAIDGVARVGVMSATRGGAFHTCTAVTVGRVPDTIRSRRNKLDEDPQIANVPA